MVIIYMYHIYIYMAKTLIPRPVATATISHRSLESRPGDLQCNCTLVRASDGSKIDGGPQPLKKGFI